ncbi:hypothetical protein B5M09_003102 [Aphanomyces astaci]|uniref:Peptidase n=1 Tax=Aphanomyces astaci TaxID=112090 RepID=A0A3R7Y7P3_APHAT|nr:hypothetical protein B5M09_003102 [Aphanomyces astaci]
MTHAPGAMRDVLLFASQYPLGNARGYGYARDRLDPLSGFTNWTDTVPIAQIPQVNTTFGYLEGVYGIMNDQQLAMGESTCGAKFYAKPVGHGGAAYFDVTELTRLALERTATARAAIALMGQLAETYGYYGMFWDDSNVGADPASCAGEALTIADATGDAWMFHILPDDTGTSAVWVAQRVPDTHITAVANEFVIHSVDLADSDNFMGSANMHEIASRHGFWDPATEFDFAVAFGAKPSGWQYGITRRVWRVLTLANPHLDLSPLTDGYATTYPFSVQVGLFSHMTFGPYAPHATMYVPIFAASTDVPPSASQGSLRHFNKSALFWSNLAVGNYASTWYKFARPVVAAAQQVVEADALAALQTVYDGAHSVLASQGDVADFLTRASHTFADKGLAASHSLFDALVTRFHDGSIVSDLTEASFTVASMGYPQSWLDRVGYYDDNITTSQSMDENCNVYLSGSIVGSFCVLVVLALAGGFHLGQRANRMGKTKRGYAYIQ